MQTGRMPQKIDQSIPTRFTQVVAGHAERVALKSAIREYSYSALDRAANTIAHAILDETKGKRGQIGILTGQETGIIAVLGTLKAGQIYVPLDTSYPMDALASILRDCDIDTIVAENK